MPKPPGAENRLVVEGRVFRMLDRRESPAGIAITRFVVEHRSEQDEAGERREARLRILVAACGKSEFLSLDGLEAGAPVRVEGFLHQEYHRDHGSRFVLHADRVAPLEIN